jgi:hypothetical protein
MTTDITLYGEQDTPQQRFIQQYFSADHLSNEEYLDFQILQTEYTGGESVNVKRYLSRSLALDGQHRIQPIWIWGLFCYPKERLNVETGEIEPKIGVVFRLGTNEVAGDIFLSMESVAATNFVKRSIVPMIQRGILTVGDWSIGLPIAVWEVPAKVGHSYRFRILNSKEANEDATI